MEFLNPKHRVFLGWALLLFVGFLSTHFYQHPNINYIWSVISILGLLLMYKYMPLGVPVLRKTFLNWLVVIIFGMAVSFGVFYIDSIGWLLEYLGVFWLFLLGIGFLINKLLYPTQKGFLAGGILQLGAAGGCLISVEILFYQYIIASIASSLAMLLLVDWQILGVFRKQ